MMHFDKSWFDIFSIFTREGMPEQISIHAFKQPYSCKQFFIELPDMSSPTFWEDMHKLAMEHWLGNKDEPTGPPCPRCGTTRQAWKRWYLGRAFCGFCGMDCPPSEDDNKPHPVRIPVK